MHTRFVRTSKQVSGFISTSDQGALSTLKYEYKDNAFT